MARITIEDCLKEIPNRFELTLCATYRARQLLQGHTPKVEAKDKMTVLALREIAAGKIGLEKGAELNAGIPVSPKRARFAGWSSHSQD